jgi:hypothetical protein
LTKEGYTAGALWTLNANNGGDAPAWEVHDLNRQVPTDWFVLNAVDTNTSGYIVGTAVHTVPDPANPTGPLVQVRRGVLLIPVELVKVTPKLNDEAGTEIADSGRPKLPPESNPMIEEARRDQIPNVAYRNLWIRVPGAQAGDKIKWSMKPLFTPTGQNEPRFRGQWPTEHVNRFEQNSETSGNGFELLSQQEARTTLDGSGETAIRINLPPIGFNKAAVKIEIEKFPGATAEVIFEVPAIVVIDPGHGGVPRNAAEENAGPTKRAPRRTTLAARSLQWAPAFWRKTWPWIMALGSGHHSVRSQQKRICWSERC